MVQHQREVILGQVQILSFDRALAAHSNVDGDRTCSATPSARVGGLVAAWAGMDRGVGAVFCAQLAPAVQARC